jgi:hypothetical protein
MKELYKIINEIRKQEFMVKESTVFDDSNTIINKIYDILRYQINNKKDMYYNNASVAKFYMNTIQYGKVTDIFYEGKSDTKSMYYSVMFENDEIENLDIIHLIELIKIFEKSPKENIIIKPRNLSRNDDIYDDNDENYNTTNNNSNNNNVRNNGNYYSNDEDNDNDNNNNNNNNYRNNNDNSSDNEDNNNDYNNNNNNNNNNVRNKCNYYRNDEDNDNDNNNNRKRRVWTTNHHIIDGVHLFQLKKREKKRRKKNKYLKNDK